MVHARSGPPQARDRVLTARRLPAAVLAGLAALAAAGGCGDNLHPCRDDQRYRVSVGAEDQTFTVGPYLEHTTETTVAVGWESTTPGDTRLEYGNDAGYGKVVTGAEGTMHQVVVEGLAPGRTYHYRACTGGVCTRDLTFATAPRAGTPIRFAVYGDCQDNPDVHHQVVENIIGDGADLAVVVGDTVSDGSVREQYKERFYDPARRFAHYAPRWAAVGNHDRKDKEVVAFRDYHIFPEDPGVPQAETSYSFTYGDAFFLVIDNTLDHLDLFFPFGETKPQLYQWLEEQVSSEAAQRARWRFAFAHYPPDSNCYEDGHVYSLPESAVREYLLPLLWQGGFQGYFAGHMHCYERFDFDGHLAITTGGGGGGVEPEERCDNGLPEARYHRCVHHHVLVETGCDSCRVRARDVDGNVIEEMLLHPDGTYQVVGP
jgi:hypothetical protein